MNAVDRRGPRDAAQRAVLVVVVTAALLPLGAPAGALTFTTPFRSAVASLVGGAQAPGVQGGAAVDAAGTTVAFAATAEDAPHGDNPPIGISVTDDAGSWAAAGGAPIADVTLDLDLSADGDVVVFTSERHDLDGTTRNGSATSTSLWWQAVGTSTPTLVSRGTTASGVAEAGAYLPQVDGDGSRLVYVTDAGDLAGDAGSGLRYVMVDGLGGATPTLRTLAVVGDTGAPNPPPIRPALSADGSTAAWLKVVDDTWHLQSLDLDTTGATVQDHGEIAPSGQSTPPAAPSISADGTTIVQAVAPSGQGAGVVLVDRADDPTETTTALRDLNPTDAQLTLAIDETVLSGDGRYLAWVGNVSVAAAGDGTDTAVWRYDTTQPDSDSILVSARPDGSPNQIFASGIDVDTAGTAITFDSVDQALVHPAATHPFTTFIARPLDPTAPTWGSGALQVTATSGTTATLAWPTATDDVGVTAYAITIAGRAGETLVTAPASGHTLTGLTPETPYTFTVVARDRAGNSSQPLTATASTGEVELGQPTIVPLTITTTADTATLGWPAVAEGFAAYRILRGPVGGALTEVGTVDDAQDPTFTDTGLDPSTGYDYQVRLERSTGTTYDLTGVTSATTGPLVVTSATWVDPVLAGTLARGRPITVSVVGSPRATAEVDLAIDRWVDGVRVPEVVTAALTDLGVGLYGGQATLPADTAELRSMTARLDLGSATATRPVDAAGALPREVAAAILVDLQDPGEELTYGTVALQWDGWPQPTETVTDAGPILFDDLAPGSYTPRLWAAGSPHRPSAEPTLARPGLITEVDLVQPATTTLTIDVADDAGGAVSGWLDVEAADGTLLTVRHHSGRTVVEDLLRGQVLTVTSTAYASRGVQETVAVDVPLDAATTDVEVVHQRLPRSSVTGQVTGTADGAPIPWADVRISQTVQGYPFVASARTGEDGRFTVDDAFQGPATVTVSQSWQPGRRVPVVFDAAVEELALTVPTPTRYELDLRILTDYLDSDPSTAPLELSPETSHHYHLSLNGGGVWLSQGQIHSRLMSVTALPGTVLTFCAHGYEVGLPHACTSSDALPETAPGAPIALELDLVEPGRASATLLAPDGSPYEGAWVAGIGAGAQAVGSGSGSAVDLSVTAPAERVTITAPGFRPVVIDLGVEPGTITPLGTHTLRTSSPTFTAAAVVAGRSPVAPGEVVEVRASWTTPQPLTGASLDPGLPDGASVVEGSVLVDGRPTAPIDGRIPLPDPVTSAVVSYRVTPPAGGGPVTVAPRLGGTPVGGGDAAAVDEVVDVLTVGVRTVTISVPPTSPTGTIVVSGRTQPAAVVTVLDGATTVAEVTASQGGAWRAEVDLPDRGDEVHLIAAQVVLGDTTHTTEPVELRVDATDPVLQWIAVSQPDRVRTQVPLTDGDVPQFPFIWIPNRPVHVEARFDDPDRVRDVRIRVGADAVPAELGEDGTHVAELTQIPRGRISVAYDVVPAGWAPPAAPDDLGAIRDRLPAALGDLQVVGGPEPFTDEQGREGFQVEVAAPSLPDADGAATTFTYSVVREEVMIDPEASADGTELSGGEAGSPTVYDPIEPVLVENDDGSGTLRFGGTVLASDLPPADGAEAQLFARAAAAGVALPRFQVVNGVSLAFRELGELQFARYSAADGALSASGAGGPFDAAGALFDQLGNCDPGVAAPYRGRVSALLNRAAALAGVSAATNVAGLFGGFPGAAASFFAGKAMDATFGLALSNRIAELGGEITAACEAQEEQDERQDAACAIERELIEKGVFETESLLCRRHRSKPRFKRPDRDVPAGDPRWAYDPSGYVYDGVRSQRVPGVTTILQGSDTESGPWVTWDAADFGQQNPLVTDEAGRYAWDVPEGWWRVIYQRDGYEPAMSRALQVLPPHTDVDVAMRPLADPVLATASAATAAVTLGFSQHMVVDAVAAGVTVAGPAGPVDVIIAPVDGEQGDDGQLLARTFTAVPATSWPAGTVLDVVVDGGVASWTGRVLGADAARTLSVPVAGGGAGGGGGGGSAPPDEGEEPDAPGSGGDLVEVPVEPVGGVARLVVPTAFGDVVIVIRGLSGPAVLRVTPTSGTPELAGITSSPWWVDLDLDRGFASADVCLPGTGADAERIVHGLGSAWTLLDPIEVPGAPDGAVCGRTSSFSPFSVGTLDTRRLAGADRIQTAVAISRAAFPDGAAVAYLARSDAFPDALAIGPRAAGAGPVLLTPRDGLAPAVAEELRRLGVAEVVLVGGEAALGTAVEAAAAAVAPVTRLAGADRYATAAAVAGTQHVAVVYLATGTAFPDALSGGAAAAREGAPLLLTRPDLLPATTRTALQVLQPDRVVLLGGTQAIEAAVAAAVAETTGATVERIAGADRYATSAAVAAGWDAGGHVVLATGQAFPDALAGAPLASGLGAPVLLTPPAGPGPATADALLRLAPTGATILGGEAAISGPAEVTIARTLP
jgi:putative cell wall-binding protein